MTDIQFPIEDHNHDGANSRRVAYSNIDDTPDIDDLLPSQTGNAGYVLKTDGSASYWDELAISTFVDKGNQSSTVTFDLSISDKQMVTLTGNVTISLSNVSEGQVFYIRIIQDGTGSRTVTWFSTIKWPGGVTPTLTTTASKIDVFGFICVSSGNYDGFVLGQNL